MAVTERAKTVTGLLEEHRRRKAAAGRSKRRTLPLTSQIPALNPINKWYKERGINIADVRRA